MIGLQTPRMSPRSDIVKHSSEKYFANTWEPFTPKHFKSEILELARGA